MTDEREYEHERERERVDTSHLDGVEDGCGCTEVWEHLSDGREAETEVEADSETETGPTTGTGGETVEADASET